MSTETYADVEDIQKDGEEATDKILNIRMPVKQHNEFDNEFDVKEIGTRYSSKLSKECPFNPSVI